MFCRFHPSSLSLSSVSLSVSDAPSCSTSSVSDGRLGLSSAINTAPMSSTNPFVLLALDEKDTLSLLAIILDPVLTAGMMTFRRWYTSAMSTIRAKAKYKMTKRTDWDLCMVPLTKTYNTRQDVETSIVMSLQRAPRHLAPFPTRMTLPPTTQVTNMAAPLRAPNASS